MVKNKKIILIPIFGFILFISIGAILLKLPVSNLKPITILDAIFVSTSSVCTTGFSTVVLSEQFTMFGQIVIALLTQIGALGIVIFIAFLFIVLNKKLSFSKIAFFSENVNVYNYSMFKNKITKILKYTFCIEGFGAWLLALRLIPIYGVKGIWYAVFHAIMSFCNAGFDLFGANSLEFFYNDAFFNIVTMLLIIFGGLGFFVIEDLIYAISYGNFKKLSLQTRIVVKATTIILISSVIIFKILEPQMTILEACFNSVTLRTAGYYIKDFANYGLATKIFSMILMFIGAAPASTSGGMKIVALAVIILSIRAILKNEEQVVVHYRKIGDNTIKLAFSIASLSILVILIAMILFAKFDNFGFEKIAFQSISAFSDVGLGIYNNIYLNSAGKIITMLLMFLGRLGPLSFFTAFLFLPKKRKNYDVTYVEGKLIL